MVPYVATRHRRIHSKSLYGFVVAVIGTKPEFETIYLVPGLYNALCVIQKMIAKKIVQPFILDQTIFLKCFIELEEL